MSKIYSERHDREYSVADLSIALQFYEIAKRHSDEKLLTIKDVSEVNEANIDVILRYARQFGYDLYGNRLVRMFEKAVLDTNLHGEQPKVYTSFYGNQKVLDNYGVVKVRIALYAPRYTKKHDNYPPLAPSKGVLHDIKNGVIGPAEYTVRYEQELSELDPQKVYNDCLAFGKGKDVAILCYCKPPDFCHRHIATNWLKDNIGIELQEFPFK